MAVSYNNTLVMIHYIHGTRGSRRWRSEFTGTFDRGNILVSFIAAVAALVTRATLLRRTALYSDYKIRTKAIIHAHRSLAPRGIDKHASFSCSALCQWCSNAGEISYKTFAYLIWILSLFIGYVVHMQQ